MRQTQKEKNLEIIENFKSNSTLTEEDALKFGKEVGHKISKRLMDLKPK